MEFVKLNCINFVIVVDLDSKSTFNLTLKVIKVVIEVYNIVCCGKETFHHNDTRL